MIKLYLNFSIELKCCKDKRIKIGLKDLSGINFSIELKCCKDKRDQDWVSQALGDVFLAEIVHEFLLEFGQFFWHFYLELDNLD